MIIRSVNYEGKIPRGTKRFGIDRKDQQERQQEKYDWKVTSPDWSMTSFASPETHHSFCCNILRTTFRIWKDERIPRKEESISVKVETRTPFYDFIRDSLAKEGAEEMFLSNSERFRDTSSSSQSLAKSQEREWKIADTHKKTSRKEIEKGKATDRLKGIKVKEKSKGRNIRNGVLQAYPSLRSLRLHGMTISIMMPRRDYDPGIQSTEKTTAKGAPRGKTSLNGFSTWKTSKYKSKDSWRNETIKEMTYKTRESMITAKNHRKQEEVGCSDKKSHIFIMNSFLAQQEEGTTSINHDLSIHWSLHARHV